MKLIMLDKHAIRIKANSACDTLKSCCISLQKKTKQKKLIHQFNIVISLALSSDILSNWPSMVQGLAGRARMMYADLSQTSSVGGL